MNLKTFLALLARDGRVARRNFVFLILQTLLQPMLLVFIFGRVMTTSGFMPIEYKSMLLPGVMALSMVFTGVWAVAMPLVSEFQFSKEIEDRLLAPIEIEWVAVEKIFAGMIQALISGLVVLPFAWLVMGKGVDIRFPHPLLFAAVCLLVAFFASSMGLALGCTIGQTQIGLMFSLVIAPMIFFGCTYYPWSALEKFPVLQKVVLINPIVYSSEGLRSALVPQFPHLSAPVVLVALVLFDSFFLVAGLRQFRKKAIH
ncbi:MAG TPA: ABC transporter permease [Thermoanaerobaculia bacterium]|nr:ABC transporter permease [Thermoanaerobaculia bacterium]